jgi:hypothetical protein
MRRKIIFLITFVPLNILLTVILLQVYWFNYNPNFDTGLWPKFCHILSFILSIPLLVPFIVTDLGEYWPWPVQLIPFIFNGIVWGIAILLVFAMAKRRRVKKGKQKK